MSAETLKVVFKGKTLINEDTVEKIGIKDTDFVVCMNQVAKPAPKPKEEVKPEALKPEALKPEAPKPEGAHEQPKPEGTTEVKPAHSQEHEEKIVELMGMGFPR